MSLYIQKVSNLVVCATKRKFIKYTAFRERKRQGREKQQQQLIAVFHRIVTDFINNIVNMWIKKAEILKIPINLNIYTIKY